MKRYEFQWGHPVENVDGEWIRYEDHCEAMKRVAGETKVTPEQILNGDVLDPRESSASPALTDEREAFRRWYESVYAGHIYVPSEFAAWMASAAHQRAATPSASPAASIYQELDPSGTWEPITKERYDDMITLGESRLVRVVASPAELTGENDAEQVRPEVDAMARQQSVQVGSADSGAGAGRDSVLVDDFRGDTSHLIRCIEALISMSDAGALVPHGIGGHARALLSAAAVRLAASPADQGEDARDAENIDYSLQRGDTAYSPHWGEGRSPVEVVDVNWALRAIAVRLAKNGGIVVWPAASLTRHKSATSPAAEE